tara:strand:+ start:1252 stop:1623 length:372 start_codon:yes stop_codon:yes gene_type:complete
MTQVSNKFNHYVDGVLVETTFEDVALPKPTTVESAHELDDGRELKEADGTDFTPVQRYAQFDYLKNKHHYERKYPSMEEQLDMLYWDKINSTDTWKEAIDKIKTDTPKIDTSDMSKVKDEFGN